MLLSSWRAQWLEGTLKYVHRRSVFDKDALVVRYSSQSPLWLASCNWTARRSFQAKDRAPVSGLLDFFVIHGRFLGL